MANESKSFVLEEQAAKPAVRVSPPREPEKSCAEISAALNAWTEDG